MNKKSLLSAFLIAVLVCGVALAGDGHFETAFASKDVTGIIASDATWTKANSPYTLTGPTAVNNGVTLTIEPGVTVNLGTYYLQVNGTLYARGSSTDNIIFSSQASSDLFQIIFTQLSSSWSEQTGAGSIIENAIINASISITGASPKISNNLIRDITASMMDSNVGITISGGSPIISNNYIIGGITVGGEGASVITNNIITGGMGIHGGSHVISNNKISGGSSYFYIGRSFERDYDVIAIGSGSPVISGNNITGNSIGIGFFEGAQSNAVISNNTIYGCGGGISIRNGNLTSLTIKGNVLMNNGVGIDASTNVLEPIERNLISNNTNGIQISSNAQLTIRNNTIANNSVGISSSPLATIICNNIQNNIQYSVSLSGTASDINASYNWWGTTDTQAINQSIYDVKRDYNLGKVNFIPFLTEPNPQAMPDPNMPIPTPITTPSPSPSPSQNSTTPPDQSSTQPTTPTGLNEIEIAILTALIIIIALLIVIVGLILKKRK